MTYAKPTRPHVKLGPQISGGGSGRRTVWSYQIAGLPDQSSLFRSRKEAEKYLEAELAKEPLSRRPQTRKCMCCREEFFSEGIHNRLCQSCRGKGDALGAPQRPAIPRSRNI